MAPAKRKLTMSFSFLSKMIQMTRSRDIHNVCELYWAFEKQLNVNAVNIKVVNLSNRNVLRSRYKLKS